jgi:hypothetical protein
MHTYIHSSIHPSIHPSIAPHIPMHPSIHGCPCRHTDMAIHASGCTHTYMHRWMDGWVELCIHACMYACAGGANPGMRTYIDGHGMMNGARMHHIRTPVATMHACVRACAYIPTSANTRMMQPSHTSIRAHASCTTWRNTHTFMRRKSTTCMHAHS